MMNNIVRLDQPQNRSDRRKAAESSDGTGEIVIFPGVRYERWDEVKTASKSCDRGGGTRRDFIEL